MKESFLDEGPGFVGQGYKFEPVFNANAIQTGEFSLEEDSVEPEEQDHEDAPVPFRPNTQSDW